MVILISYIYSHNNLLIKTIYQAVNIISTEAELFTIRCGINQAVSIPNVNYIVIITDSLHAAKRIFDSLSHPYQIQSASISQELRDFFNRNNNNCIKFWDCSSKLKWLLYSLVDKDIRKFDISPVYSCKSS